MTRNSRSYIHYIVYFNHFAFVLSLTPITIFMHIMTFSIAFYPNLRCHEHDDMMILIAHDYLDSYHELYLKKVTNICVGSQLYSIDRNFLFFLHN